MFPLSSVNKNYFSRLREKPIRSFLAVAASSFLVYTIIAIYSIEPIVQGHIPKTENTDIYVLDSGLNPTHRLPANVGVTQRDFTVDAGTSNALVDCSGHGTIVSNILARESIALDANINVHSLKVFGCAQSVVLDSISIHTALLWVLNNHDPKNKGIVNMSLHFGSVKIAPANYIIDALSNRNVIVVVSAGNDGDDACNYAPGNLASTIAVGNLWVRPSDNQAKLHGGSNSGDCVDIYSSGRFMCQPNERIRQSCTGTSFAAPVVVAKVAKYINLDPNITLAEIKTLLAADSEILEDGKYKFIKPSPYIEEEALVMYEF